MEATVSVAPNAEGRYVLDTDASAVAIARILHQEQEHNGKTFSRPIVNGCKSSTKSQLNYSAPKLEIYAVFYFKKIPRISSRPQMYATSGQPGVVVAENVLHGSGHDRALDSAPRPVPLPGDSLPTHTAQKR